MTQDLILSIDNGTQSVRALIFDLKGNLLYQKRVPMQPYVSRQPGWAEQDVPYYWKSLCQACQMLWSETSVPKEAIAGVTLTSQRCTMINLDRNGNPLRPAMVWLDQRRTSGLKPIGGFWGLAFKLSGMSETVAYLQAEAESNWIKRYQPEVWSKTHKFLFLSGYLTYRLTGQFVDSIGCQVGYIPFDYKKKAWASSWNWKWPVTQVEPRMLPDLIEPAGVLGQITRQAAADTGIPEGLPVFAAAADKACEVLGAGCLEPHIGCLSYGTSATINTTHYKYIEAIPLIPPYPSAVPDAYSLEIQIYRGYWMVSWFSEQFAHMEQQMAGEQGVKVETLIEELLHDVPPGSMGLILQPYWSPGIKVPGPEAKGAVIGFGDVHNRAHFYRAILEGLAYALREGKEREEKRSGVDITELRVSGGGSQSNSAMQLTADIFGMPTARSHIYETSGLGAAIDAAVGLKMHRNFKDAVAEMTRIGQYFEPDLNTHKIYDQLYNRVYKQMYKKLKPLYEEIRDITGYPKRAGEG
ncbi:MAG: carbohydrate kinase [Deltaproteobacteria bacterium HGW-Deltaproteobacteria-7]|jgi:sugar (pentulose or hexulose) kinase|nr:MAG: carbohydrate kinase [Deltaproteobacteria bacterium HGW-Deltaproteobacteria-7]PKN19805.1 MAG: carbohydrate kinase [Deltaproteobacteria bacterium HGW-Deltaproteobacteria-6]